MQDEEEKSEELPQIIEDINAEDEPEVKIDTTKTKSRRAINKAKAKEGIFADFPLVDGKTMHLEVVKGDVANRVIICSNEDYAWKLSRYFDDPEKIIDVKSHRHFRTLTGLFQGVPISIIGSGTGKSMVDFTMREAKYCIDGTMAVVMLGICNSISNYVYGDVVVASRGVFGVQTDFDVINGFNKNTLCGAYRISDLVVPDQQLSDLVVDSLTKTLTKPNLVKVGMNGSSDAFYGSQGRNDDRFPDKNDNLIAEIIQKYPHTKTLDMESYNIVALSKMTNNNDVVASAVNIVVDNRYGRQSEVEAPQFIEIEDQTGYALIKALADYDFQEGEPSASLGIISRVQRQ